MVGETERRRISHRVLLGRFTILLALFTQESLLAQDSSAAFRDRSGIVCLVSTRSASSSVQDTAETEGIIDVHLRAPGTLPTAIASKLPAGSRDFSTLPIEVFIVPSAHRDGPAAKPRRVEPLSMEPTLVQPIIDGVQTSDFFVRVTYPRDVLQAGYDLVAQRTALAENGEKVISQTRCRIREEDVANWK